jgi:uncharacterized protein
MQLMNQRTAGVIASDVEIACTRASRRRGLLDRDSLDTSAALVLSPCFAIHTAFMRFPIDVLFVDRKGIVRRVVSDLRAWRMAADARARTVIELAGGVAARHDVRPGDRLYLASSSSEEDTLVSSSFTPSLRRMASNPACSGS